MMDLAGVPPTLVKFSHVTFNINDSQSNSASTYKVASLQRFMEHDYDVRRLSASGFSVASIHQMILDIRLLNLDRHAEISWALPSSNRGNDDSENVMEDRKNGTMMVVREDDINDVDSQKASALMRSMSFGTKNYKYDGEGISLVNGVVKNELVLRGFREAFARGFEGQTACLSKQRLGSSCEF
ncbi:hypothetical protein HAX54_049153 [Datura stramonium]|uniref:1-phosphatidylinositol 4-kinase n=1 Tax=Datura stramonium TaxID=4076 RepID=A0ABS8WK71_DATST|nr:hypothetical protein [Datura stramonium]